MQISKTVAKDMVYLEKYDPASGLYFKSIEDCLLVLKTRIKKLQCFGCHLKMEIILTCLPVYHLMIYGILMSKTQKYVWFHIEMLHLK